GLGWFADTMPPALHLASPGLSSQPLTNLDALLVGIADGNSGIDLKSLSIKASFAVRGRRPNTELADLAEPMGEGRFRITLATPPPPGRQVVKARVRDRAGNPTVVERTFHYARGPGGLDLSATGNRTFANPQ
ncbi:MAG: hypothetical protein ACFCBW_13650, partial [Candidatus Competibacterales bacterium]